jgi:hypothetical protein
MRSCILNSIVLLFKCFDAAMMRLSEKKSQTRLSYAKREHLRSRSISTAKLRQSPETALTQFSGDFTKIAVKRVQEENLFSFCRA